MPNTHFYAEFTDCKNLENDLLLRFACKRDRDAVCEYDTLHYYPVKLARVEHRYDKRHFSSFATCSRIEIDIGTDAPIIASAIRHRKEYMEGR